MQKQRRMKASVCPRYGTPDVLELRELEKPVPKDNEVLIKIMATTVNAADARIRGAVFPFLVYLPARLMMGFNGPRNQVLGLELAGIIEQPGAKVSRFKTGDTVFASTGAKMGAHAEYVCLPEHEVIVQKPSNMSFDEATAVPHCALAALYYIQKANVQQGQKVMIYGASGGIGTFAVQLANVFGAEVTGVCSTPNIELVKSLGANQVIDYTKANLAQRSDRYDVIFDTIGKAPIPVCVKLLKKKGQYLSAVHLEMTRIFQGIRQSMFSDKKVIGGVATYTIENLKYLKKLIEAGKLSSVIDRKYPLEQIAEAHAYVDKGHKKGHVVITLSNHTNN